MSLNQSERDQYSRHLILNEIGEQGQLKLKTARVLVVGAGGLGCPILQYLTAAGVGLIGIIDGDHVDKSNLQRQVLYTHQDLGLSKAKCAAKRLSATNPHVKFKVYPFHLKRENALEIFSDFDIVVDGSDNFPTRYLVNDAAVLTNKPLVFGSIFKFEGQVSVFNYKGGPNYRSLYPKSPEPGAVPNCSDIGVLGVLPGIIGTLQANEILKMICGIGQVLSGRLLLIDALSLQINVLSYSRSDEDIVSSLEDDYDFFCGVNRPEKEMSYDEFRTAEKNFLLLDVRTYPEREIKHIGGIHIPLDELSARWEEIPQDQPLLVYCKAGIRSQMAIQFLKQVGFKNSLVNLSGGILAMK